MRTSDEIREEIASLRADIEAVVNLATEEKRELEEDEQQLVDKHVDDIQSLESSLDRAVKLEKQRAIFANQVLGPRINKQVDQVEKGRNDNHLSTFKVPARARAVTKLKAFKGEDAEREAYITGQFFLGAICGRWQSRQWCQDHGVLGALTTSDNSLGGYLVPDEMQRAIIRLREERGVFPRYANRIPMGSDVMQVPRLLSDVTAYWTGEGEEITASDPTIGNAELMARKIAVLTKISSELDQDAVVEVGDMLAMSMAYAAADKVDEAGFNGDGTSTYGGVLGLKNALNANAIHTADTGNNTVATLELADYHGTVAKCGVYSGAMNAWFVHSAVYHNSMARLQVAAGGNTVSDVGSGPVMQFLGYPVVFCQVLPSAPTASQIACYFGDLRLGATYGVRRSARTEISVDRYFENDQIGVRYLERLAIAIHERGDTIRTRPIVALKLAA